MGVLLFIFALLIVIMIHEAGHFTAAKLLGFKATKFFVGFGPTLWSRQKGETEYGVKAIPAGGFVKIVGMNPYEEVPPEDESRAYYNRPRWQRAIVILAGPATHWPLALLVLSITFMTLGQVTGDPSNRVFAVEQEIEGEESPAAAAGFEDGDVIVAVDGEPTSEWDEVRQFIREHPSDEVVFTVEREGSEVDLSVPLGQALVTPEGSVVDYGPPGTTLPEPRDDQELVGFLGVSPDLERERLGFFAAIGQSGRYVGEYTVAAVEGVGQFFGSLFNGDFLDQIETSGRPEGTGIVGAGRGLSEIAGEGLWDVFLDRLVFLTIFIGLINLLPLVPLDGGHLMVILWETITRKRVDMRKLIPLAAAVLAFFVILSVVFLYYDIVRPPDIGL
jgi:membrane-associated protease RseP (regulator of RpoE activity)